MNKVACIALCAFVAAVSAQTAGFNPRFPHKVSQSSTTHGWTEQGWLAASHPGNSIPVAGNADESLVNTDNTFDRNALTSGSTSSTLYAYGFDSPIPDAATITGIQVYFNRRSTAIGIQDVSVELVVNDAAQAVTQACPSQCTTYWAPFAKGATFTGAFNYGNSTSLWGLPANLLTPTIFNQDNFGVQLKIKNQNAVTNDAYIDQISIIVYYTTP